MGSYEPKPGGLVNCALGVTFFLLLGLGFAHLSFTLAGHLVGGSDRIVVASIIAFIAGFLLTRI